MMREVPGPNPHEYGIVNPLKPFILVLNFEISNFLKYKQNKKISRNRKVQSSTTQKPGNEFLESLAADHKLEQKEKIRTEFFRDIDRKAKEKRIKAQVENIMEARNYSLYERRNRFNSTLKKIFLYNRSKKNSNLIFIGFIELIFLTFSNLRFSLR